MSANQQKNTKCTLRLFLVRCVFRIARLKFHRTNIKSQISINRNKSLQTFTNPQYKQNIQANWCTFIWAIWAIVDIVMLWRRNKRIMLQTDFCMVHYTGNITLWDKYKCSGCYRKGNLSNLSFKLTGDMAFYVEIHFASRWNSTSLDYHLSQHSGAESQNVCFL